MFFVYTSRIFFLFLFLANVLYPTISLQYSALNFPYSGAYLNTSIPTFTGMLKNELNIAMPNESLQIFVDGNFITTTQTDQNGIFVYMLAPEYALSDGTHTMSIVSGVTLGPVSFVIDTSLPPSPVISTPSSGATLSNPVVISGTTTYSQASVCVFLDGSPYADIVYADDNGNWTTEYTLQSGEHSISAQVQSLAGNQGPLCTSISFFVS